MNRIHAVVLQALVALFAMLPLIALAQSGPDVVVTITESEDPVLAGSSNGVANLTYTVRATNGGDAEATGVELTITLTLPPGVSVSSITPAPGLSWADPIFSIGTLGVDGVGTLTVVLSVSGAAGAADGAIGIGATVTAMEEEDAEPDNDFANLSTSITTFANFQVSKDFSDDSTAAVQVQLSCSGGDVDDPISVTEGPVSGITVSDFPAGTSCTVTETVPAGYSVTYADGCTLDPVPSSLGNLPCLITNTQNPVQFVVNKTFTDGSSVDVTVSLVCEEGTVVADDPTASGSDPAEFTISDFPVDGTTCTATETLPSGYAQESSTCTDVAVTVAGTPSCGFVNVPLRTTFEVTKEFTDGDNPTLVEVSLSCNTGLILDQSKVIDETESVIFVVTDFDHGELDCEITEEGLAGYSPTYDADGPGEFNEDGGCNFANVGGGSENTCHIVNDVDPVEIEIEKEWVFEGSSGSEIDTRYELTLYCDAEIVDGDNGGVDSVAGGIAIPLCNIVLGAESPAGPGSQWCKVFYSEGSDSFIAEVIPNYPSSNCYVEERVYDDAVEIDNGCGDIVVSAGNGDSCTITNTVFFEGIPTLNPSGRILMIVLVLGIAWVAYRRIA
jgi:hypothetical protein